MSDPSRPKGPKIIAITNQKGGVGKTTTAINLGAELAAQGYNVLIVDIDPQGNASTGIGIEAKDRDLTTYDLLLEETPLQNVIQATETEGLWIAPATTDRVNEVTIRRPVTRDDMTDRGNECVAVGVVGGLHHGQ